MKLRKERMRRKLTRYNRKGERETEGREREGGNEGEGRERIASQWTSLPLTTTKAVMRTELTAWSFYWSNSPPGGHIVALRHGTPDHLTTPLSLPPLPPPPPPPPSPPLLPPPPEKQCLRATQCAIREEVGSLH